MNRRLKTVMSTALLSIMLLAGLAGYGMLQPKTDAYAGAVVDGDPNGANYRMLVNSNGTSRVRRIVYFKMESHATGGANTPVPSGTVCDLAGTFHYAEVQFTGTLSGSNPTLAIKWQNSKDGGTTWSDVGTWTTINATVTPASQTQTFADSNAVVLMNANTPVVTPAVVYGDCWRATYTMSAGAAGNFSITGLEK